jgi:hypothetical protein
MDILLKMMVLIIMAKWKIIKQVIKTGNIGHKTFNMLVALLITKFKVKGDK